MPNLDVFLPHLSPRVTFLTLRDNSIISTPRHYRNLNNAFNVTHTWVLMGYSVTFA